MKCHKCGEKIEKELKKCPFCGADIKVVDDLDLPDLKDNKEVINLEDTDTNLSDNYFEVELKDKEEDENSDKYDVVEPYIDNSDIEDTDDMIDTKEFDLSLEKTKSINPLTDTIELKNISLIDDINKQIEEINEEAQDKTIEEPNSKLDSNKDKENDEADLTSLDSMKKRKKVLLFAGISSLILAIGMVIFIIVGGTNKDTIKGDYLIVLDEALTKYYETSEYEEIIRVLNTIKKDENKITSAQEKTKEYVLKWVDEYIDMDIKTLGDFEEVSTKYKSLINDLHINALITYNNRVIKVFKDSDYDEIEDKMDKIYNDSSLYFVAMDYYNQNDYNRAYTTFGRIESSNLYYKKANDYKSKIINNIMKLIENDIAKIEEGIEILDNSEKLNRFTQVEQVLIDYNKIYSSIDLKNETSYQMLLQEYSDKVSEYAELISEKNDNNSIVDDEKEKDDISDDNNQDNKDNNSIDDDLNKKDDE